MKTTITPEADAVRPLKPSLDHIDKATARPLIAKSFHGQSVIFTSGDRWLVNQRGDVDEKTVEVINTEHAALVAVAEALQSIGDLANDPAGSTYTLKELFGTFQHGVGVLQVEGQRALKALANLAAVRGQKGTL